MLDRIPTPITTARLVLRPYAESEAETRFRIHSDPQVRQYLGQGTLSREQSDKEFRTRLSRHRAGNNFFLLILDRPTETPIGDCLLMRVPPGDPELALALLPQSRNKGFGLEAASAIIDALFASTPLTRLVAKAQPSNALSLALCRKLGMRQIGTEDNHWDDMPDIVFRLDASSRGLTTA